MTETPHMIHQITPLEYLQKYTHVPLIDVRSPAEYAHAHLPGAYSVPLFSNEERALIGTIYKHTGKPAAIETGLNIVGPRLQQFIKRLQEVTNQREVIVYCWRGGMRSKSLAMLFAMAGYTTHQIIGGYKAVKEVIRNSIIEKQHAFVLLGGKTGSGKTALLNHLQQHGEQVIDLEGLAHHKGSAYGALGQQTQPSQEQFLVNLFYQIFFCSPTRPIWFEHEGTRLGDVHIPPELSIYLETARVIYITVALTDRVTRILKEYGQHAIDDLIDCTKKLEKQLGGKATQDICSLLKQNQVHQAVLALLEYYDRAYTFAKERNASNQFIPCDLTNISTEAAIEKLIATAQKGR